MMVADMKTLWTSGVLNSKRDLNRQFGEWFVKTMFDGQYAPNVNQKRWDINIGEKRVQAKAHAKDSTNDNRFSRLKYHEETDVHELITVVFTHDYKLKHVYRTPWLVARDLICKNKGGDIIHWDRQKDFEVDFKDLPNQALVEYLDKGTPTSFLSGMIVTQFHWACASAESPFPQIYLSLYAMDSSENANAKPWDKFPVNRFNERDLFDIYHVTHVDNGLKVIKDSCIRPFLVGEDGILGKERIQVSWFSPNFWVDGFLFGNVRFTFQINTILDGRKVYWVEEVLGREHPTVRFFVTSREKIPRSLLLYRPESDKGPFVLRTGKYYRSGVVLEFMIDDELSLDSCLRADFVDHHAGMCGRQKKCPYLGEGKETASCRMLGSLITQSKVSKSTLFLSDGQNGLSPGSFFGAVRDILKMAEKTTYLSLVPNSVGLDKLILLVPFFSYLITYQISQFQDCIRILDDYEEFKGLFFKLLNENLGISDLSIFDES